MRWRLVLPAFVSVVHALYENEVGIVDWHQSHVGVPLTNSRSASPSFQSRQGRPPQESLIISGTTQNVLAALHTTNGSVAWRYVYEPNDRFICYSSNDDTVVSLSGPGGELFRRFERSTGHLLVEKRLDIPENSRLSGEPTLTTILTAGGEDTFVLSNGHVLQRLDREGNIMWTWTSSDQTSLVIYSKLLYTPSTTYVLGLAKSFASYTLHIVALSTANGEEVANANVPSSIVDGKAELLTLSHPELPPRVAWLQDGAIHSVVLVPVLVQKPFVSKDEVYTKLVDVGLEKWGRFVAIKSDGSGVVLELHGEKPGLRKIWDFADSAKSDKYTDSFYVGAFDKDGHPYIGRIFWSHTLAKASAHIYAPHLAEGSGLVSGYVFPFDTGSHGVITHATLHIAYVKEFDLLPYIAVTTSTGAVQLWEGNRLHWSREEGLAHIQLADMVELPENQATTSHVELEHEAFTHRLARHISDARNFPQYLARFITRFVTSSYESATSPLSQNQDGGLARDTFGFRKLIIAASEYGKIYALDSSTGQVVWSRVLSFGRAAQVGASLKPVKLFTLRSVADEETPQIVLVAERRAHDGLVDTVLFHIDVITGADARGGSSMDQVLQGIDIISGPIIEAYLVSAESKFVVFLDKSRRVYLYPDSEANALTFSTLAPSMHIPLLTGAPGARQLIGHSVVLQTETGERAVAQPTWTLTLPNDEDPVQLLTRPTGPVASLGRVLGNRTTLYKYLNPHLFAVTSARPDNCALRVLDAVKGSTLYHTVLPRVEGSGCDIQVSFVENWLVYVYWDPEYQWIGQAKGRRIVTVELYEGNGPDDKTNSADISSFSPDSLRVAVYEQAYVFPHAITAITTTQTKFGVTSKDLIVANENGQIQSYPRIVLNPRRPKGKPTAEQQEEMLIPYDPIVPDDARRVLSHEYEIANVRGIITSPALLESTSLVFAYGLDLFGTRVAPSRTFDILSESFNKTQLVATVLGLLAAIAVSKPMVSKKRLRERWYRTYS